MADSKASPTPTYKEVAGLPAVDLTQHGKNGALDLKVSNGIGGRATNAASIKAEIKGGGSYTIIHNPEGRIKSPSFRMMGDYGTFTANSLEELNSSFNSKFSGVSADVIEAGKATQATIITGGRVQVTNAPSAGQKPQIIHVQIPDNATAETIKGQIKEGVFANADKSLEVKFNPKLTTIKFLNTKREPVYLQSTVKEGGKDVVKEFRFEKNADGTYKGVDMKEAEPSAAAQPETTPSPEKTAPPKAEEKVPSPKIPSPKPLAVATYYGDSLASPITPHVTGVGIAKTVLG